MNGIQRLGLGFVVLAHFALAGLCLPHTFLHKSPMLTGLLCGIPLGQAILLATCGAFASRPFLMRAAWTTLLGCCFWVVVVLSTQYYVRTSDAPELTRGDIIKTTNLFVESIAMMVGLLSVARFWPAWRIAWKNEMQDADQVQFTLRELFLLIACIGCVLGLAQALVPKGEVWLPSLTQVVGQSLLLSLAIAGVMLIASPLLWCQFAIRTWRGELIVLLAFIPGYALLLGTLEGWPLASIARAPAYQGIIAGFCFNFSQFVTISLSISVLRYCGFRFERKRSIAAEFPIVEDT